MQLELQEDVKLFDKIQKAFNKSGSPIERLMLVKALQIRVDSLRENLEEMKRKLQPDAIREALNNA